MSIGVVGTLAHTPAAFPCAAELLGIDKEGLVKALTTRTRHTPEGAIISPLSVQAATENRDSLAKIIYAKMFDWLVARINNAIGEDKSCAASIGVLDIYGFESFKTNDFEQFCINLANEKLQQHFNHHVFKQEQAEYEREKIDWSYIKFVDNQVQGWKMVGQLAATAFGASWRAEREDWAEGTDPQTAYFT